MTFSVAARSEDASLFGIAIASSSPAVAARCVHLRTSIGAVASQNITDPALGQRVLQALERGLSAHSALEAVLSETRFAPYRQLIVVGRNGPPAVYSGARALGIHAAAISNAAAAAGNLLANDQVPQRMLQAFDAAGGHFGSRLLRGLEAGQSHGGEAGAIHSAALCIVRDVSWPIVDLRVDWDERDPIAALSRLWEIYAPQIEDYVKRALDPVNAASFGVPGDP